MLTATYTAAQRQLAFIVNSTRPVDTDLAARARCANAVSRALSAAPTADAVWALWEAIEERDEYDVPRLYNALYDLIAQQLPAQYAYVPGATPDAPCESLSLLQR